MSRHGRLPLVLLLLTAGTAAFARPAGLPTQDVEDVVVAEAARVAIASVEAGTRRPPVLDLRKVSHPSKPAERYGNDSRRLCAPAASLPSPGEVKCKEMVRPQARDSHALPTEL